MEKTTEVTQELRLIILVFLWSLKLLQQANSRESRYLKTPCFSKELSCNSKINKKEENKLNVKEVKEKEEKEALIEVHYESHKWPHSRD